MAGTLGEVMARSGWSGASQADGILAGQPGRKAESGKRKSGNRVSRKAVLVGSYAARGSRTGARHRWEATGHSPGVWL